MSELRIVKIETTGIVEGKFGTIEKFAVVDESDQPVDGKLYDSLEAAEKTKNGMADLVEGLAFAKARYPGLSDKAQRGKANVVAEYVKWLNAGRPVSEEKEEAPTEGPSDEQF